MSNPPIPPPVPLTPPVPTLGYAYAQGVGRPGMLTAVGVVSIIMAILSLLNSLLSGVQVVVLAYTPSFIRNLPGPGATTAPANPGSMFANLSADPVLLVLGLTDAVLRLGLSILLVVAAIKVLRDRRAGRKLHLVWACVRILVAVLGAVASYLLMEHFRAAVQANMPAGSTTPTSTTLANLVGIFMGFVMSIAYPVGVLIVMNTRRIKDFYQTLGM